MGAAQRRLRQRPVLAARPGRQSAHRGLRGGRRARLPRRHPDAVPRAVPAQHPVGQPGARGVPGLARQPSRQERRRHPGLRSSRPALLGARQPAVQLPRPGRGQAGHRHGGPRCRRRAPAAPGRRGGHLTQGGPASEVPPREPPAAARAAVPAAAAAAAGPVVAAGHATGAAGAVVQRAAQQEHLHPAAVAVGLGVQPPRGVHQPAAAAAPPVAAAAAEPAPAAVAVARAPRGHPPAGAAQPAHAGPVPAAGLVAVLGRQPAGRLQVAVEAADRAAPHRDVPGADVQQELLPAVKADRSSTSRGETKCHNNGPITHVSCTRD
ncbi:hypothetical protein ONE63_001772 [Megalurothrips usitatus]|uniref:Uncharacterized protein n=1 Tax=Megalurothrips usitatus TaxID=439358 RepID=A0AAV7XAE0_9NEOP|nr:hypothetical protein ONE63_001772 [Megalurothrips usitatus]